MKKKFFFVFLSCQFFIANHGNGGAYMSYYFGIALLLAWCFIKNDTMLIAFGLCMIAGSFEAITIVIKKYFIQVFTLNEMIRKVNDKIK